MTDEFKEAQEMFDPEDMSGGLANVKPPDSFYAEAAAKQTEAEGFIIPSEDQSKLPYKDDKVLVAMSPEDLVILTEILENCSVNMHNISYLEKDMSVYEQQSFIRAMRDKIDNTLMRYCLLRHYKGFAAFLTPWIKKIGRDEVLKELVDIEREQDRKKYENM